MLPKLDYITILGLVAGSFTTIAFLPQVIKTWKSRSTQDISLGMFTILCTGILLWVIYGFYIDSLPVIIANLLTFILALTILILKLIYK